MNKSQRNKWRRRAVAAHKLARAMTARFPIRESEEAEQAANFAVSIIMYSKSDGDIFKAINLAEDKRLAAFLARRKNNT